MFLNSGLGLGMGLSIFGLSLCLRLIFFKSNLLNHKNMRIQKTLYPEKQELNQKIKNLQV